MGVLIVASDVDVLARFGRALADPTRCRILLALRQEEDLFVSRLAKSRSACHAPPSDRSRPS
ncbi:hypothetical protein GCM10017771_46630 [Streptomyces capitiformicae]|uniref:HTH arsR-type domain-containing protein n=1 Tax=Streptomyces capitiformicae TaxID=2014920 RepID=A0A918Z023_9ACTN|nr:hypothetical protein GCM10017771_46630 [Streptomyces capitiformicae]